ncbi:MAG: hypothetical protein GX945_05505 [Lentisphaerae bacterium]|nr:hypothetical protein [Lentisphaerota bacterium]
MVTKATMRICRRLSVVLLLLTCAAAAGELGASLQLEGRMACQRGAAWLIACQAADGSWQQDTALSAQAALALVAVAADVPSARAARSQAIAYLQESLAQTAPPLSPDALVAVLRLFLREDIAVPPKIVARLHAQVAAGETPARDAMPILETLLLLQRGAVAAQPGAPAGQEQETARLVELLYAKIMADGENSGEQLGECLAARMAMGAAAVGAAAQQRLKELRGAAGSLRFTELYWLARVLYAQADAEATWRTPLLIMLLEKQRGDGGWGGNEENPEIRLVDSAWALQALAVLLAEALPQGE